MNIGWAVNALQAGEYVTRKGWNGGLGMFLFYVEATPIDVRDEQNSMVGWLPDMQSFIAIRTEQGTSVPWVPSQTDLLATDWGRP